MVAGMLRMLILVFFVRISEQTLDVKLIQRTASAGLMNTAPSLNMTVKSGTISYCSAICLVNASCLEFAINDTVQPFACLFYGEQLEYTLNPDITLYNSWQFPLQIYPNALANQYNDSLVYMVIPTSASTWQIAYDTCQKYGYRLAMLKTMDQMNLALEYAAIYSFLAVDLHLNGSYTPYWGDGTLLSTAALGTYWGSLSSINRRWPGTSVTVMLQKPYFIDTYTKDWGFANNPLCQANPFGVDW